VADLSIKGNWFSILKKKNLTESQKDMVEWNKEDWVDMANPKKKKKKGTYKKGRYAPKAVAESLTPSQRAYENKKKRKGRKQGKQNVPRGKTAKKVYRRVEGRSRGRGFTGDLK
jgi:hypothetical protein